MLLVAPTFGECLALNALVSLGLFKEKRLESNCEWKPVLLIIPHCDVNEIRGREESIDER